MPRFGPLKYQPLTDYLAALTADEATLTFAEIEAIIGTALPSSAWTSRFWANAADRLHRLPQKRAWRRAGWRVVRVHLEIGRPAVTFAREAPSDGGE